MARRPAIPVDTRNGVGDVAFTLSGQPDTLTLVDNGDGSAEITGTVGNGTASGSPYSTTVGASDDAAQSASETFNIIVAAKDLAVTMDGLGTPIDHLSTPNQASFNSQDLDIRVDIRLDDWGLAQVLADLYESGSAGGWFFRLNGSGTLTVGWGNGVTGINRTSSVAVGATDGDRLQLRVALDVSPSSAATFYTRAPGTDLSDDTGWTQLGAVVSGSNSSNQGNSTVDLTLGRTANANSVGLIGRYYAFWFSKTIDGPVEAQFDVNDGNVGDATVTDSTTGDVWTLQGDAEIVANS